ncbi:FAD-linked oxidoreductase-like protein [Schizophyllum commune]
MGALFAYSVEVDEGTAMGAGHDPTNSPRAHRGRNGARRRPRAAGHASDRAQDVGRGQADGLTSRRACAMWNVSAHILEARKGYRDPPGRPGLADVEFPGAPHDLDLDVVLKSKGESIPGPLTQADAAALAQLYSDLCRICTRARERGVRIIIDAEYSWYQPAIDALTHALSRKFNVLEDDPTKVQPLVYGTYQAYLRRTPAHIARVADAHAGGYSLGVKLVRGAYHPHEVGAWKANLIARMTLVPAAEHPPVWSTKPETDACYDRCVSMLIDLVADDVKTATSSTSSVASTIAAPVAGIKRKWYSLGWGKSEASPPTSSADLPATDLTPPKSASLSTVTTTLSTSPQLRIGASCAGILGALEKSGLGYKESASSGEGQKAEGPLVLDREATGRVTIGQLYGMSDDLTESVAARVKSGEPFVIKYIPYGALSEVLLYLGRRAIENKSMLFGEGGAAHERERAWAEIRKRVFG